MCRCGSASFQHGRGGEGGRVNAQIWECVVKVRGGGRGGRVNAQIWECVFPTWAGAVGGKSEGARLADFLDVE